MVGGSAYVDLIELQNMLDYLQYNELTAKSMTKLAEVYELSKEVNRSIMNFEYRLIILELTGFTPQLKYHNF